MQTNHRIVVVLITIALAVGIWTDTANAQTTQYWSSATGGDFGTPTHWNTAVPGTNDTAVFDLNEAYTVDFASNVTNVRAQVSDGEVIYSLAGHTYTVTEPGGDFYNPAPFISLTVAQNAGDTAKLTLDGGNISAQDVWLGMATTASGTLILTNNVDFTTYNTNKYGTPLIVGHEGTGVMIIANSTFDVNSRHLYVGNDGGYGSLTVSGASALLRVKDSLFISRNLNSTGQLIIENGATVQRLLSGSTRTYLGVGTPPGTCTVTVRGANSLFDAGTITEGSPQVNVNIEDGATIESTTTSLSAAKTRVVVTGTDSVWQAVTMYLSGTGSAIGNRAGEAIVTIADSGRVVATNVTLLPPGSVRGNGTLQVTSAAGFVNRGSLVAPGMTNPAALGTLTIDGKYTQEVAVDGASTFVGTLRIRIGQSGSDKLAVTGDITLNGTLDLVAFNSPSLDYDATFDILDWSGALSGEFSQTNEVPLPGDLWWDYSQLYIDGTISVTGPARGTMISVQ